MLDYKNYKPFTDEQLERNLSIAFKDLLYPRESPYASNKDTQEFALEYLQDMKRELLEAEQYEKLAQFARLEYIYGYVVNGII